MKDKKTELLILIFLIGLISCTKEEFTPKEIKTSSWKQIDIKLSDYPLVGANITKQGIQLLFEKELVIIDNDFQLVENHNFGFEQRIYSNPFPLITDNLVVFTKLKDNVDELPLKENTAEILIYNISNGITLIDNIDYSELFKESDEVDLPFDSPLCVWNGYDMLFHFKYLSAGNDKFFIYSTENKSFEKSHSINIPELTDYTKQIYVLNNKYYLSSDNETVLLDDELNSKRIFDLEQFSVPFEFRDTIYLSTQQRSYISLDNGESWNESKKKIQTSFYPLSISEKRLIYRLKTNELYCNTEKNLYTTTNMLSAENIEVDGEEGCYKIIGIKNGKIISIKGNKLYYAEL